MALSSTSSNWTLGVSSGVTIAAATLAESDLDGVGPLALPAGLTLLEDDPLAIFSLFLLLT
ncbi:hypothetical protein PF008_g27042 [Phytophthora fragariae]|uniref:Uncharacterized protein n=1 Tax=Phytophthora fragariae TaxID=53985 RepID=A0A6G0QFA2_9STRA|nr:hypothetical protein PF008_g27042 [Phytophthora fragariae]